MDVGKDDLCEVVQESELHIFATVSGVPWHTLGHL